MATRKKDIARRLYSGAHIRPASRPSSSPPAFDREQMAIARMVELLATFPLGARKRMLEYVASRVDDESIDGVEP